MNGTDIENLPLPDLISLHARVGRAVERARQAEAAGQVSRGVEMGEAWMRTNGSIVGGLVHGTVIAVNVADGRYVTASSRVDALDAFEAEFGASAAAFIHEVGVPATVGGGFWTL
jgi:hypothetical protein